MKRNGVYCCFICELIKGKLAGGGGGSLLEHLADS